MFEYHLLGLCARCVFRSDDMRHHQPTICLFSNIIFYVLAGNLKIIIFFAAAAHMSRIYSCVSICRLCFSGRCCLYALISLRIYSLYKR